MAYVITETRAGVPGITSLETTAGVKVGTIVRAEDPTYGAGEFIYLAGVASCALGSWVTYNMDDGSTTLLAANAIGPVAVAMAACTASYYGWFQISGKAVGKCLTQFADNGKVFITATAGSIDDTSVAGDWVNRAKGASATVADSGVADFEIERPFVDNISSST
jgi:hypothetical protein